MQAVARCTVRTVCCISPAARCAVFVSLAAWRTLHERRSGALSTHTRWSEYSHRVLRVLAAVQVSWPKEGLRMAQLLLSCGVNDLGGVLMNESISTAVRPSRRVGYSEYSRGVH